MYVAVGQNGLGQTSSTNQEEGCLMPILNAATRDYLSFTKKGSLLTKTTLNT
jgi:hypothetical protein